MKERVTIQDRKYKPDRKVSKINRTRYEPFKIKVKIMKFRKGKSTPGLAEVYRKRNDAKARRKWGGKNKNCFTRWFYSYSYIGQCTAVLSDRTRKWFRGHTRPI